MWIHTKCKHIQKVTCTHKKIKAKQSLTVTHGLQNTSFLVWAQTGREVFVSATLPTEQMSHLRRQVPSDNVNAAPLQEAGSMGPSYQKERQQGKCVRQIPIALLVEGTRKRPSRPRLLLMNSTCWSTLPKLAKYHFILNRILNIFYKHWIHLFFKSNK